MGRKQKKCPKKCEKHLLHLRPFHSIAYLSRDVLVSFCPTSSEKTPNYPCFNRDHKHYTPSFFLKEDQPKYQTNDSYYYNEHNIFCQEQNKGKSQMLVPKPRSKNQYCYVCKEYYQDYYSHVKSNDHKVALRKNRFSQLIDNFIKEKYPRRIQNPSLTQNVVQSIQGQCSTIQEQVLLSLKSVSSIETSFNQKRFSTSFRPVINPNTFSYSGLGKKVQNNNEQLIELGDNKIFTTPQNSLKLKNPESEQKKSPLCTKVHIPIVLNSPIALL